MSANQFAPTYSGEGAPTRSAPHGFRQVQTRRTFEEVAAQVRDMLFGGALRPGDRLPPERELALLLGVGRPALREALRALEVGGLIELRKGKTGGAFISSGSQRVVSAGMSDMLRLRSVPIGELFEAREWVLSSLVRPACIRITAQEIQALRENIDRAEQLHLQGHYEERIDTNFEFHSLLARATRNSVAEMIVRGLSDSLRILIHQVGSDLAPNFFDQRRSLLKAIEDRNEVVAAERMAEIVKATEQTYRRLAETRGQQPGIQSVLDQGAGVERPAQGTRATAKRTPVKAAPKVTRKSTGAAKSGERARK